MEEQFIADITSGGDETPALIYADWLEDQQRYREAARWRDGLHVGNRRAVCGSGIVGGSSSGSFGGGGGSGNSGNFGGGGIGGGNFGGGFNGGGFGGDDTYLYEEYRVCKIGDQVLVALAAGDRPFVFAGRVVELYSGCGFDLWPASMLPWSGENGAWLEIAHGDERMRKRMRVRPAHKPVNVGRNLSWSADWEGDLPLVRQN